MNFPVSFKKSGVRNTQISVYWLDLVNNLTDDANISFYPVLQVWFMNIGFVVKLIITIFLNQH